MSNNISFIVPCFNCADTVGDTISSIINDNIEHGDEIIFINDASTDNTLEILKGYERKYSFVKVLNHNINKGTAVAGRNTGIDSAKNELVFCLDADNILYPGSIKKLKAFLLNNNLDVAAFGKIDFFRENTTNVTHSWEFLETPDFIQALNDPKIAPCGSGNYMFTKSIWRKVDRCDEFHGGAFDSDLFGLKLLAEGAAFQTLKSEGYLHRYGYESTYMKDYAKKNTSLLYLSALMNYINLIDERDVEYMFGKGRLSWKENISKRPLRAREGQKKGFLKKIFN